MEQSFREVCEQLLTFKQMLEEAHEREMATAFRGSTPIPDSPGTTCPPIETPKPPDEVPTMLPMLEDYGNEEVWEDDTAQFMDERTERNPLRPHTVTSCNSKRGIDDTSMESEKCSRELARRVTVCTVVKDITDKFEKKSISSKRTSEKIGTSFWKRGFDLASKVANVAAHFDKKIQEVEVEDLFKIRDHWCLDDEQIVRIRAKRNLVHRCSEQSCHDDDDSYCGDDDEILTAPSRGASLFFTSSQPSNSEKCQCIHPQSRLRLCWEVASLFLFTYDVIFIPMAVFDLPKDFHFFDLGGTVYWTLDIGFSFGTGVYIDGHLVRNPSLVAQRYIKTWMPFDAGLVFVDWVSVLVDDFGVFGLARALRGGRFVRILRLFRFLRLLRLIKARRLLSELSAKISSPAFVLFFSITQLLLIGLLMAHSLACLWYAVGIASSEGWVYIQGFKDASLGERYIICFQYGLARLHPSNMSENMNLRTTSERMLAIFATLVALVFSSLFISCITTTMGDLSRLRSRRFRSRIYLNEYISQHRISPQLARQGRRWLEKESAQELKTHLDIELFEVLPVDLMTEFRVEAWSPVLLRHPLFNMIHVKHPRTESTMCYQALSEVHHFRGTQVFTTGDPCTRMLFTVSGDHYYKAGKDYQSWLKLQQGPRLRNGSSRLNSALTFADNVEKNHVGPGLWLCEAAIYTHWQYCGDLRACTDVTLLAVSADEVAAVAKKHEQAFVDIALYAQCFLEELNRFKGKLTDLPNLVQVTEEDIIDASQSMSAQSTTAEPLVSVVPSGKH